MSEQQQPSESKKSGGLFSLTNNAINDVNRNYKVAREVAKKAKSLYSKTELQGLMLMLCGYLHDTYLYESSEVPIVENLDANYNILYDEFKTYNKDKNAKKNIEHTNCSEELNAYKKYSEAKFKAFEAYKTNNTGDFSYPNFVFKPSNGEFRSKLTNELGAFPRLYKKEILELHQKIAQIVSKFNMFFNDIFFIEDDNRLPTLPTRSLSPNEKDMISDMKLMSSNSFLSNLNFMNVAKVVVDGQKEISDNVQVDFVTEQDQEQRPVYDGKQNSTQNVEYVDGTIDGVGDVNIELDTTSDDANTPGTSPPSKRPLKKIVEELIKVLNDKETKHKQYDPTPPHTKTTLVLQLTTKNEFATSDLHPYKYSTTNAFWIFTEINELQKYALFFSVLLERLKTVYENHINNIEKYKGLEPYEKYIMEKGKQYMNTSGIKKALRSTKDLAVSAATGTKSAMVSVYDYHDRRVNANREVGSATGTNDNETINKNVGSATGTKEEVGSAPEEVRSASATSTEKNNAPKKGWSLPWSKKGGRRTRRRKNKKTRRRQKKRNLRKLRRFTHGRQRGGEGEVEGEVKRGLFRSMGRSTGNVTKKLLSSVAKQSGLDYIASQRVKFQKQKQPFDGDQVAKYEFMLYFNSMFDLYITNAFRYDVELDGIDNTLDPSGQAYIEKVKEAELKEVAKEKETLDKLKKYYANNVDLSTRAYYGLGEGRTQAKNAFNFFKKMGNGHLHLVENAKRLKNLQIDAIKKTGSFMYRNGLIGTVIAGLTLVSNAAFYGAIFFPPSAALLGPIFAATSLAQKVAILVSVPFVTPAVEILRTKEEIMKKFTSFTDSNNKDSSGYLKELISNGYDLLRGLKNGSISIGNKVVDCNFGILFNEDPRDYTLEKPKDDNSVEKTMNEYNVQLDKTNKQIINALGTLQIQTGFEKLSETTKMDIAKYYLNEIADEREVTVFDVIIEFNSTIDSRFLDKFFEYMGQITKRNKKYIKNEIIKYQLLLKSYYLKKVGDIKIYKDYKDLNGAFKIMRAYIDKQYEYRRVAPNRLFGTNEYLLTHTEIDPTTVEIIKEHLTTLYKTDTPVLEKLADKQITDLAIVSELKLFYKKRNANIDVSTNAVINDECDKYWKKSTSKTQSVKDHCRAQKMSKNHINTYVYLLTYTIDKNKQKQKERTDMTTDLNSITSGPHKEKITQILTEMILYSNWYFTKDPIEKHTINPQYFNDDSKFKNAFSKYGVNNMSVEGLVEEFVESGMENKTEVTDPTMVSATKLISQPQTPPLVSLATAASRHPTQ